MGSVTYSDILLEIPRKKPAIRIIRGGGEKEQPVNIYDHVSPLLTPPLVRRIKLRRKELKINQTRMADLMGVSQPLFSKIEAHKLVKSPTPVVFSLQRLCDLLEWTPEELFHGKR